MITLYNNDCIGILGQIDYIDHVVVDLPYFNIVKNEFDNQWKTLDELRSIGNAYIKANSNQSNKVVLRFDKNYNLDVGDIVELDRPSFLIEGKYIVTDIVENYLNTKYNSYGFI